MCASWRHSWKDRANDLIINENIKWLKNEIEQLAPADPDKKQERDNFYNNTLKKLTKELQGKILAEIFGVVTFIKLDAKGLKSKKRGLPLPLSCNELLHHQFDNLVSTIW